ncbi:amidohydrolase family protein [Mycobacterium xenopi 4042]|uniref:Amidohydrolase family protein n=1 Tax=Mycobacterium xenopi 4042 TaxID=1299334 RepID=X7ZBC4_MYCXE|nr:amidohydrolase family protein [Mycobacterium xenopi 4042]
MTARRSTFGWGRGSRRSLANSRRGAARKRSTPRVEPCCPDCTTTTSTCTRRRPWKTRCGRAPQVRDRDGLAARWPMPQSEATAGSGRSATTIRWPARWTERCSTPSRRRCRCAYSTGAARCGSSTRRPHPGGVGGSSRRAAAQRRPELVGRAGHRGTNLAELSRRLARYGVTGVTDATPDLDVADIVTLTELHRRGELRQHVRCLSPGKRILHDDDLDLDALAGWIAERHRAGGPVAIHCVTAAQLVVTVAALRQAGTRPGDRIEHAAVAPPDSLVDLAALGLTVVTQPNFVAERGDEYLAEVPAEEHGQLWRVASLLRAGVAVALSTDMPFGRDDPWAAMRAAVHRTTPVETFSTRANV